MPKELAWDKSLNRIYHSKTKPVKGMAMAVKYGCGAWKKHPWPWVFLALSCLIFAGILSLKGQNLSAIRKYEIPLSEGVNPLLNDPVFSPLAQSVHFRKTPFHQSYRVVYEGHSPSATGFSWSGLSESQWWITDSEDVADEYAGLPESDSDSSPGQSAHQDMFPKLQYRDIDPQAILSNFIAMGVADLLNDLRENDLMLVYQKDESPANPFDKALKEAQSQNDESASETDPSDKEDPESQQTAKKEDKGIDKSLGMGGSPLYRNLLFVGSFNNQAVATAIGGVQPDLLRQALNNTVFMDLPEIGRQTLDMDVIIRDRDRQESAAFGDLNRDGVTDLVLTNKKTNKTSVYRNEGFNNYRLTGEIFGGLGPSSAIISDFNADGSPDIAVSYETDSTIVVDGKGFRRFIFLPTSRVKKEFSSMLPGDFNGDGLPDLLLSNYKNLTATVYLNRGEGLFVEADTLDLLSFHFLQSKLDLNGDGIEDTVYVQCLGDRVSIAMEDGNDGIIRSLGNMVLDPSLFFVLGDFNLDGVVDIAIARSK
jgi:hypothetical protein